MLDSGVYDEYSDSCMSSELDDDILRVADDYEQPQLGEADSARKLETVKKEKQKVSSFVDLTISDACWNTPIAETTLRQVRDSYNDLRIREESSAVGRSDLGPLTGRFDRACRLSKSYYFGGSNSALKDTKGTASNYKKISLSGLDLDCYGTEKSKDFRDCSSKKKDEFVETLKRLFNSRLEKYGSASGSLCSTASSSNYSSQSNEKVGAQDESEELCNPGNGSDDTRMAFIKKPDSDFPTEATDNGAPSFNTLSYEVTLDLSENKKDFADFSGCGQMSEFLFTHFSEKNDKPKIEQELEVKDQATRENVRSRTVELELEETLPKLNWDFLEEQLEKAILREKTSSCHLRDEVLRKMAVEAKQEDTCCGFEDKGNIYRMSCTSLDNIDVLAAVTSTTTTTTVPVASVVSAATQAASTPAFLNSSTLAGITFTTPAVIAAASTAATVTGSDCTSLAARLSQARQTSIFKRPLGRRSKPFGTSQLQVCFVNEMSLEDDDGSAAVITTTSADVDFYRRHYAAPPSEYSTICSGLFSCEDSDVKSLGNTSHITRSSIESSKSSLHPLPALTIPPKAFTTIPHSSSSSSSSLLEAEENFFTRQARLQAEARLALAQVRPMSYMQFLLEKQARRESSPALQFSVPGVERWSDLKRLVPSAMRCLNATHLQIIINYFLSEITGLNEELMDLLVQRDELYIVQDSMLVDIEDFTRRAEEWEYRKLMGSRLSQQQQHHHSSSTVVPTTFPAMTPPTLSSSPTTTLSSSSASTSNTLAR